LHAAQSEAPSIRYSPSPPGEEKGLGDEVGKHAQFVFCEPHGAQKLSSKPCS